MPNPEVSEFCQRFCPLIINVPIRDCLLINFLDHELSMGDRGEPWVDLQSEELAPEVIRYAGIYKCSERTNLKWVIEYLYQTPEGHSSIIRFALRGLDEVEGFLDQSRVNRLDILNREDKAA